MAPHGKKPHTSRIITRRTFNDFPETRAMIPQIYIFFAGVAALVIFTRFLKFPLPIALIAVSILTAIMGGFGIPFRHLVEGGFGYLNLVLALFAGAFFGQALQKSGIADAFAGYSYTLLRQNNVLVLIFSA